MKKIISLSLMLLFFTSFFVFSQNRSYKRGVSYNIPYVGDVEVLSPGISWFYNWDASHNSQLEAALGEYEIDFLPMAWDGNYNETAIRNYLSAHPNIKYLLGFNEPNFWEQANMSPTVAAAKWKDLEKIADDFNLKLVAPAVNYSPNPPYQDPFKYLDEFFEACSDCRIDYIAVHCYMSYPSAVMWYIDNFKKYGKPIWLTEFCAWDEFWNVPGDAAANQLNYMVNTINYLEHDPDVYRYAWFIPRTDEVDKWPFMQLLEDNKPGELTKLGKVFVHMSSQDKSHYFKVNNQIPAEHYTSTNIADIPNSDHWKSSISLEPTNDSEGILNIWDFNDNRWVEYNINVPQNDEYKLMLRVAAEQDAVCQVLIDGSAILDFDISSTGSFNNWQTQEKLLLLTQGQHTIRLKITSGNIKLNWLTVHSDRVSSEEDKELPELSIHFSPDTNMLHIDPAIKVKSIQMYNIQGQLLHSVSNKNEASINNLTNGIFLIKVNQENGYTKTFSIVKK